MLSKEIQLEVNKGAMLPLMEEFYTIQGEGSHTGTAAYFVRIGGCDVGCHWCDVKESWNAELHPPTSVDKIVENAVKYADTVVVTGGEPLTWDMTLLTSKLKERGLKLHIETSGAYPLSGTWDWICLSPKKFKFPIEESLLKANEFKVVIYNKKDFDCSEPFKYFTEKCNGWVMDSENKKWLKDKLEELSKTKYIQN